MSIAKAEQTDIVGVKAVTPEPMVGTAMPEPVVSPATNDTPVIVAPPLEPEVAPGRDHGKWHYTPWHGRDMWTSEDGLMTSFDEKFVIKHRHISGKTLVTSR